MTPKVCGQKVRVEKALRWQGSCQIGQPRTKLSALCRQALPQSQSINPLHPNMGHKLFLEPTSWRKLGRGLVEARKNQRAMDSLFSHSILAGGPPPVWSSPGSINAQWIPCAFRIRFPVAGYDIVGSMMVKLLEEPNCDRAAHHPPKMRIRRPNKDNKNKNKNKNKTDFGTESRPLPKRGIQDRV